MANIYSLLFGGIGKTASVAGSAITSGIGAKMAIGAGVGGIYGGMQSESASGMVSGALKGSILGAAAGGAIGMAPTLVRATPGMLWKGTQTAGRSVGRLATGKGLEGMAGRTAMWAINHPIATAGIAGGIYAGASVVEKAAEMGGRIQSTESPYMTGRIGASMTYNKQALAAQRLGQIGGGTIGPPSMMQDRFEYAKWLSQAGITALGVTKTGRLMDSTVGLPFGMHNRRHS